MRIPESRAWGRRWQRQCVGGLLAGIILSAATLADSILPIPSLVLPLDRAQEVEAGDLRVRVAGDFADLPDGSTALGIGRDFGPSIPAAPFFAESGTLAFSLCYEEPAAANRMFNRHLVTLRLEGRGFLGFYFIRMDRRLQAAYKQLPESIRLVTPERLNPGQTYRAAVTWDGAAVCFYLDGMLVGEMKQGFPARYPDYAKLHLGPYKDAWVTAAPWQANDVSIRDLKIWKHALDAVAVAADAGIEAVSADMRFPPYLRVPQTVAAPELDGSLDEPAWQGAASFVSLLDLTNPEKSLSYADNRPLFLHDSEALYIGLETVFPASANLVVGQQRGAVEPEVWPDESFEVHLDTGSDRYRFAGNLAGGYCEMRNTDSGFDGAWQYVSSLRMGIDGRQHWQGEIRIPFATIGMSEPLGQELKINVCRTWRCLEEVGLTSLQTGTRNYGNPERFATIRLAPGADAGWFAGSSDPSFGRFSQRLTAGSAHGGDIVYTLKALNASGDGPVLVEKRVHVPAGEQREVSIACTIDSAASRHLLFQLADPAGEPLMQQLVPFQLREDYLEVTPVFGSGRVLLTPRYSLLTNRFPEARPRLRIAAPDGRIMHRVAIDSDTPQTLPFDRDNPSGTYSASLVSGQGDALKVHSAKAFVYTGSAPWEDLPPIDSVPPPFEELRVNQGEHHVDVSVWGRRYRFEGSTLPASVTTQEQELLAAPAHFLVNGTPAETDLRVTNQSPLRVAFAGRLDTDTCLLEQEGWLEYDGVSLYRLRLKARRALDSVVLVVPFSEKVATFAHATAAGFGGGGRRNIQLDSTQEIPFYPSVWIGNEEHGLAWFAESAATWQTRRPHPLRIVRDGAATRLEVTFADALPAGSDLKVEFGLLATPVKPLPTRYPLNLFSSTHGVHLNRPEPWTPVIHCGVTSWEGAGFFDLPLDEEQPQVWRWLQSQFNHAEKHRAIFTPYTAAMAIPEEYPEAASRIAEWQLVPAGHLGYTRDGTTRNWYRTCAAADAGNFFAWKFDQLLDKIPLRGIYLDFGAAFRCNNTLHGCQGGYPLLAQRRLYQRLAHSFVRRGIQDYAIVVHNSECVQWPTFTHVTHFFNGEGLRQMSSPTFHDGKDLLDTYTRLDFAAEHSSLPFGITSSVYVPTDPLLKQFGGGQEDQELYRFRMTKAALAGALPHHTIPSPSRLHYGWFDKLVRIYDAFDVPAAEFLPYWRNQAMVTVLAGKDIYVSLYRAAGRPEVLAVIAHLSKEHLDQNVAIDITPAALGLNEWLMATELLTADDPGYERLYAETNRIRMPVKLGDFGVDNVHLDGTRLTLTLKFHSVALVRLTGR